MAQKSDPDASPQRPRTPTAVLPPRRRPINPSVYAGPGGPAPVRARRSAERLPAGVADANGSFVGSGALSYDLDAGDANARQDDDDVRRRREYREAGDLTSELVGELTGVVHGVHTALAGRVFRLLGAPAKPVEAVHTAVANGVYGALRVGGTGLAKAAAFALATRPAPPPSSTGPGGVVLGAVNGVLGGELDERGSPLSVRMGLWADGSPVTPTRSGLTSSYPDATSRVVVFAHGLCENERAWHLNAVAHWGDPSSTHGARLRADLGCSPVYLRYNTGRHISDNGRQFSDLLQRLVDNWPVPVEELVLVGHSMGGLLIRSACHEAEQRGMTWPERVRHMIYLGSPHFGAPLARLVHVGSWGLAKLPETAPVAKLLNRRSPGIRDLRYGTIVEADWRDLDPDALRGRPPSEIPLMPQASHYYIGATVTADKGHPVGRVVGDTLVQFPSASGRTRRRRLSFEVDNGKHIGGLHHMDLLNHPLVYEHLRTWLAVAPHDVEAAVDATDRLPDDAP